MKVVSLDRAGEPLSVGNAGDLDLLSRLERLDGHVLAHDQLALTAQLEQATIGTADVVLLQVAELGLRDLALGGLVVGDLDRVVTVRVCGLDLHDGTRRRLDHRHGGDDTGLGVEDPRHAELLSDDSLQRVT